MPPHHYYSTTAPFPPQNNYPYHAASPTPSIYNHTARHRLCGNVVGSEVDRIYPPKPFARARIAVPKSQESQVTINLACYRLSEVALARQL